MRVQLNGKNEKIFRFLQKEEILYDLIELEKDVEI